MKDCVNCGTELPEGVAVCPQCGATAENEKPAVQKVKIGLAVVSFFIPIAGIVLFFTKKKTQPKTAKACGFAAAAAIIIAVIAGLICSGNHQNYPVYAGDSPVVYGSFDDSAYQNEYYGIRLEAPDGWRFETYDEIVGEYKEDYYYEASGVPFEQGKDWKYYHDAVLSAEDTYSKIMIVEFPQDEDFPDEASVLDYYADTKKTDGAVVGRTKEYYKTKAGGCEFLTCNVQYDLTSYKVHSGFFVTEKDGWYILINVMLTNLDGRTPADYIQLLQALPS